MCSLSEVRQSLQECFRLLSYVCCSVSRLSFQAASLRRKPVTPHRIAPLAFWLRISDALHHLQRTPPGPMLSDRLLLLNDGDVRRHHLSISPGTAATAQLSSNVLELPLILSFRITKYLGSHLGCRNACHCVQSLREWEALAAPNPLPGSRFVFL